MRHPAKCRHGNMLKELSHYTESRHIAEHPSYQKPRSIKRHQDYWRRTFYTAVDVRYISKSWKDQTRRKNQYKVKDM